MIVKNKMHLYRTMLIPIFGMLAMFVIYTLGNNQGLFLLINNLSTTINVGVWSHITAYGDAAIVVCLILPFFGRRPEIVLAVIIASLLGGLTTHFLKDLFEISRPPGVFDIESIHVHGPVHTGDSFPSGHSLTAWVMVSILFTYFKTKWKTVLLILAVLVSLSRLALGVHWPQDVLAGMVIGWVLGQLSVYLTGHWQYGLTRLPQKIFGLILIADAVALFWYHNGHPETFWMQYIIASVCLLSTLPVLKSTLLTKDMTQA